MATKIGNRSGSGPFSSLFCSLRLKSLPQWGKLDSAKSIDSIMHRIIYTLVAVCFLSVATVSMAEDKAVTPIQQTAAEFFQSDSVESLTPEKQIREVFRKLVKTYGVKNRLEIAKAVSALVPADLHGYVAKRALAYSPVKAKELLAALSQQGASSAGSALSTLPASSIHTAATASAAGVSIGDRTFNLPQIEARRRIDFCYGKDGVSLHSGDGPIVGGDLDGKHVNVIIGPVSDNGFTKEGMGYTVTDDDGNLIGVYLAAESIGGTLWKFSIKNVQNGDINPGSGDDMITVDLGPEDDSKEK